jgi:PKD repeat protein
LSTGVTLNSATGLISGTPTAAGTSSVTLSATNGGGTSTTTRTLTLTVFSGYQIWHLQLGSQESDIQLASQQSITKVAGRRLARDIDVDTLQLISKNAHNLSSQSIS